MKLFNTRRFYSTISSPELPILIITNLHEKESILSKRDLLINKAGIYSFLNNTNDKQYRGSAASHRFLFKIKLIFILKKI